MGKTWGMKQDCPVVVQDGTFTKSNAAVVWWPRVEKVEARNLSKSLQSSYLRIAIGIIKSNRSVRSGPLLSSSGLAYCLLSQTNCIQT